MQVFRLITFLHTSAKITARYFIEVFTLFLYVLRSEINILFID